MAGLMHEGVYEWWGSQRFEAYMHNRGLCNVWLRIMRLTHDESMIDANCIAYRTSSIDTAGCVFALSADDIDHQSVDA